MGQSLSNEIESRRNEASLSHHHHIHHQHLHINENIKEKSEIEKKELIKDQQFYLEVIHELEKSVLSAKPYNIPAFCIEWLHNYYPIETHELYRKGFIFNPTVDCKWVYIPDENEIEKLNENDINKLYINDLGYDIIFEELKKLYLNEKILNPIWLFINYFVREFPNSVQYKESYEHFHNSSK